MNRLPFGIGDFVATFKGDTPGHPFRGNQFESGSGGSDSGESSPSSGSESSNDSPFDKVANRIVKRGGFAHVGGPRDTKKGNIIGNQEGFFRVEDVFHGQGDSFVMAHPIGRSLEQVGSIKKIKGTFVITDDNGVNAYLKKGNQ